MNVFGELQYIMYNIYIYIIFVHVPHIFQSKFDKEGRINGFQWEYEMDIFMSPK